MLLMGDIKMLWPHGNSGVDNECEFLGVDGLAQKN